jgi:hypothetical protein
MSVTKVTSSNKTTIRRSAKRQKSGRRLAPDGLPWPPGYFDQKPRMTFSAALKKHGVRPNHYHKGWPVYTKAETTRPEFHSDIMDEPQEIQDAWNAEWERRESSLGSTKNSPR